LIVANVKYILKILWTRKIAWIYR